MPPRFLSLINMLDMPLLEARYVHQMPLRVAPTAVTLLPQTDSELRDYSRNFSELTFPRTRVHKGQEVPEKTGQPLSESALDSS